MPPLLILLMADTAPISALAADNRALICAAAADGDAPLAKTIAALAMKTQPAAAADVTALVAAIEAAGKCPDAGATKAVQDPAEPVMAAPPPIRGRLEVGLGQTSGTTDAANANIAAALEAEHGRWSQKLRATLDYQDIEGIAAAERYTTSWDAKRTLSKSAFVTAFATFESDKLAGFRARTTQSIGFGAKFPLAKQLVLDLSGGPSWRQVDWIGERAKEGLFGARGSAAVSWMLAPGVSVAASGSGIFEADSGTIEGQASITGKLIGPLATRLQLTARHETKPYPGIEPTTTTSRASLVYSF
jgi:putative salt-induced outer membrane protein